MSTALVEPARGRQGVPGRWSGRTRPACRGRRRPQRGAGRDLRDHRLLRGRQVHPGATGQRPGAGHLGERGRRRRRRHHALRAGLARACAAASAWSSSSST
ncbi:hypothetical protein [Nocardioides convexus]|uniref:hypothetical protein n=1 Tax=Nocardioides convexus TaxID=2712224 RepID=UPI003100F41A